MICTVVDDFLIVCDERYYIEDVKGILRSIWKITDGGPVQWFLNLKFSLDARQAQRAA